MSPDRWNQIDQILDVAMELPPERRASYLDEACAEDAELRREVESLLAAHEKSGAFIETTPAKGVAAAFSQQLSPEALIGRTFGHYRIEAMLGAGGMGEVYRAHDSKLDRNVAIKVLPQHLSSHPDALIRFEREAKAIAALPHPNILAIHDFGRESNVTYAVTELLEGETLRQRIGQAIKLTPAPSSGISWRETVKIAASVAEGLAAAHNRGIIHRDIKPENIFLTTDGVVKILDFGIARIKKAVVSNAETVITQGANETKPGTLMGTIGYMSPEQVRGDDADAPSDIFSLGCMMMEMLTGERPFARNSAAETMAAILRDDPPSLENLPQEIPPELERIIRRCLEKTPEERFQSARDLALDLRSLLTGTSGIYRAASGEHKRVTGEIPALSTGSIKTGRNALRPAWWISGTLAVVLAVALGAVAFQWWKSPAAGTAPQNSLAVLPLINESGDQGAEFLSTGLTDNVIANLSPLRPKLRVLASSSVSAYRGKTVDPRQAGRELNVRSLLVGKVLKQGDLFVISVELVDATDNSVIWAGRYPQQHSDLMAIQEDISRQISEKLQLNLTGEERQLLAKRYTNNSEAYSQYLTGRYFWNQRTDESYKKAIEFYRKAIELDPNYALAYVGIADAYVLTEDDENRRRAAELAHQALAIDGQLAEAHATLGFTEMFVNRNWAEAERHFKRAIELNNGYATAHHWYGLLLAIHGRFDAAFEEMRHAREIDPRSFPINNDFGEFLFYARRYDEAIVQLRRTIESEPTNKSVRDSHFRIRNAYEAKGDFESAIKEAQLANPPAIGISELQQAFAQGGRTAYLRKRLEISANRPDVNSPTGRMRLVYANAAVGNLEEAMTLLERSIAEDHSDGLMYLKVDPRFDNLRSHPRFPEALRQMKLLN